MSDYLDNLVARTLGLAEVVLPRPLSLFQPLQPSSRFTPPNFGLEEEHARIKLPINAEPMTDVALPPAPKATAPEKLRPEPLDPDSDQPSRPSVQISDRSLGLSIPPRAKQ